MAGRKQFATFWVDGLFFGIEVDQVQEVIRYQEVTRVPLAPAVVTGLINLRGQIVTAVELRGILELKERPAGKQPMNVVIRNDGEPISLLVDEISDVFEVDEASYEPPPESLRCKTGNLICGVYKLEDRLLHVLNTQRIVTDL